MLTVINLLCNWISQALLSCLLKQHLPPCGVSKLLAEQLFDAEPIPSLGNTCLKECRVHCIDIMGLKGTICSIKVNAQFAIYLPCILLLT